MTTEPNTQDVWIDAPIIAAAGIDPKLFGLASVSYPYGLSGPAIATVKFNLTGYVKHLIEQSK